VEHNLQLLVGLRKFAPWRRPLLLGVSRKAFLGRVAGSGPEADRLPASLICACWGVRQGASIIRAHDVAATRQALAMSGLLERGGVD
jgi:dihydropteroate synthase